jgi:hypothetical protein
MAYLDFIPVATDAPATSQPQMVDNFKAIKTLVSVDHATFSDPKEGKHTKVTFPVQAADPGSAAGELVLFAKTLLGHSELFYQRDNDGVAGKQVFGGNLATIGWARVGGLLLKWGNSNTTTAIDLNGPGFGPTIAVAAADTTYPVFATFVTPVVYAPGVTPVLDARVIAGTTTLEVRAHTAGRPVFFVVICW